MAVFVVVAYWILSHLAHVLAPILVAFGIAYLLDHPEADPAAPHGDAPAPPGTPGPRQPWTPGTPEPRNPGTPEPRNPL